MSKPGVAGRQQQPAAGVFLWPPFCLLCTCTVLTRRGCVQDLAPLAGCPALCSANFSGNALASIEGLQGCRKLSTLDLSTNRLAAFTQFRPLALLPRLQHLRLAGNPSQPPRTVLRSLMPGEQQLSVPSSVHCCLVVADACVCRPAHPGWVHTSDQGQAGVWRIACSPQPAEP